jgi:hypothetical protein
MGSAPRCYDGGGRTAWNNKVGELNSLCQEFNVNKTVLSQKCQTEMELMSCNTYTSYTASGGMLIKSCPKPNKWLKWVIAFALAIIGLVAAFMGLYFVAMLAFAALLYMLSSGGGEGADYSAADIRDKELSDKEEKGGFEKDK